MNDPPRNDRNDAFLKAALREVLGGQRPPDLRKAILSELDKPAEAMARKEISPPPFSPSTLVAPGHRSSRWRVALALAVMLLVLLIPVGVVIRSWMKQEEAIAQSEYFPEGTKKLERPSEIVKSSAPDPEPAKDIEMPNFGPGVTQNLAEAIASKTPPTYKPIPEAELLAQLRSSLHGAWTVAQIKPSPDATDGEWCRRTFLALLGRVPSVTELEHFLKSKEANKRDQLVTSLLGDSSYADESSKRLATLWTNVLIGRVGGRTPDRIATRAGLVDYLTRAFRENRPFDRIVKELVTATGSSDPAASDYNGAVNFLLDGFSNKATLATARTSRVFLGKQLQCVQCHDHPSADTKQSQFWGLNAFFRQMSVERKEGQTRLVNIDFRGETQRGGQPNVDEAEIYFEQKNGELKVAFPTYLDGQPGPHSGLASVVDRRAALADWIVAQGDLPRAVVNRVWSQLLGFGFSQPVDDLGPHNPATNPELLEELSQQFVAHRYDLKSLTRWIVLSDAFNRSSRLTADNIADVPEQGARPLFSRYYTRQMDPESLFDSLHIAASSRHDASKLRIERAQWLGQFMSDMKNDEADEHSTYNGGIPQSLTMMNGEAMIEAVSLAQGSTLKTVIASEMPLSKKIEHLYLASLSRPPSAKELESASKMVSSAQGGPQTGLADLWWALLNSGEFILDH